MHTWNAQPALKLKLLFIRIAAEAAGTGKWRHAGFEMLSLNTQNPNTTTSLSKNNKLLTWDWQRKRRKQQLSPYSTVNNDVQTKMSSMTHLLKGEKLLALACKNESDLLLLYTHLEE